MFLARQLFSLFCFLAVLFFSLASSYAHDITLGLYEVNVSISLPNLYGEADHFKKRVCITRDMIKTKKVFVVRSDNPLRTCPLRELASKEQAYQFQIKCHGPRAGEAIGHFKIEHRQFSGTITMIMGGKNMTIIERQKGQLIGTCETSDTDN